MRQRIRQSRAIAWRQIAATLSLFAFVFVAVLGVSFLDFDNGAATQEAADPIEQVADEAADASDDATEGTAAPAATMYATADESGYVPNTVLISVEDGMGIDAIREHVSQIRGVSNVQLDTSDVDAGFVTLSYDSGKNAGTVSDQLRSLGLTAQPNFLYYALDQVEAPEDAVEAAKDEQVDESSNLSAGTASAGDMSTPADQTDATEASEVPATNVDATDDIDIVDEEPLQAMGLVTNDPKYAHQWALEATHATDAWNTIKSLLGSTTKHPTSVAVIDSGCDVNHPDLKNSIVGTYNARTGSSAAKDVADDDPNGHGTAVAGIIAAEVNNNIGMAGISYNAGLYIVKAAFNENGNTIIASADIRKAYTYIIANKNTNGKAGKIRVVNLSYGRRVTGDIGTNDETVIRAIEVAFESHGILTVCAGGNSDGNVPYRCYPCDFTDDTIGVIALERSGSSYKRYVNSNYNVSGGRTKQLSAPGADIYTTSPDSYTTKYGTSMATPQVAGIAAMLFVADPDLTAQEAKNALIQTATDLGPAGFDAETGYGMVNADAAVKQVTRKTMYRMYNPNSGEHFYTAAAAERDSLVRSGWRYEGVAWTAPRISGSPVYRLYSGTDHHYTTNKAERDNLKKAGWKYEGVGWYSDDDKHTTLFRVYNPNVNPKAKTNNSGSHHYTTSKAERDSLVRAGWKAEGIGWYGL